MKSITKKQAIMQSLDAMNAHEMDQVLSYVKDMLHNEENDMNYLNFKSKAMREIQEALKKDTLAKA